MLRTSCLVIALATASCGEAHMRSEPPKLSYARAAPETRDVGAVEVDALVPKRIPYGMTAVGLDDADVTLVVRNGSRAAVPIAPLDVFFRVERDGVPFRCEPQSDARDREPSTLPPGKAFTTTRILHCWTPVPGDYVVHWTATLGRVSTYEGTFGLTVDDHPTLGPRPYPGRAGTYVAMGGDRRVPPIPVRRDGREDGYHVVLVVTNASRMQVAGGRAQVAFVVRKKGSPIPCGGETIARMLPEAPAPGEVSVMRVPVTCISDVVGEYGVTGQFAFAEPGSEVLDVGTFEVRVTRDPLLLWPSMP